MWREAALADAKSSLLCYVWLIRSKTEVGRWWTIYDLRMTLSRKLIVVDVFSCYDP